MSLELEAPKVQREKPRAGRWMRRTRQVESGKMDAAGPLTAHPGTWRAA